MLYYNTFLSLRAVSQTAWQSNLLILYEIASLIVFARKDSATQFLVQHDIYARLLNVEYYSCSPSKFYFFHGHAGIGHRLNLRFNQMFFAVKRSAFQSCL